MVEMCLYCRDKVKHNLAKIGKARGEKFMHSMIKKRSLVGEVIMHIFVQYKKKIIGDRPSGLPPIFG